MECKPSADTGGVTIIMDAIDTAEILVTVLINLVAWLVYTGLLWGMIKVQKLNYHLGGLFASSFVAMLVGMIPIVGGYLSYAVLLLCLWKCTGAEIVPDVVFTVCIAGALMFCFNLFAIGALMGKLRPDLAADGSDDAGISLVDSFNEGAESESEDPDAAEEGATQGRSPKKSRRSGESASVANSVGTPHPLVLKGVSVNTPHVSALVFDGRRTQTVFINEPFAAEFREGRARLTCRKIARDGVLVVTDRGEQVVLKLKAAPGENPVF